MVVVDAPDYVLQGVRCAEHGQLLRGGAAALSRRDQRHAKGGQWAVESVLACAVRAEVRDGGREGCSIINDEVVRVRPPCRVLNRYTKGIRIDIRVLYSVPSCD